MTLPTIGLKHEGECVKFREKGDKIAVSQGRR